jgi:methylmalonyl-CoA/ethylmalonyl-CoA epimerase
VIVLAGDLELEHIGWAVNSIEGALPALEALGFEKSAEAVDDKARNVRILIMENSGSSIELVAPLGDKNPVSGFLSKNGPSPYHICFAADSDNLERVTGRLRQAGFKELIKAAPAPALGGDSVIFLYSKDIGIVELAIRARK